MAAEAATVTSLPLGWAKALKSKAAPPHGVYHKYPLIAFDTKERGLGVILLQKQRIPFGSVEEKQRKGSWCCCQSLLGAFQPAL